MQKISAINFDEQLKGKTLTCTWDENSKCHDCEIEGKLDCKWQKHLLIRFYKGGALAILSAIGGFLLVGFIVSWIPLIIYLIFWIFFFGFFEIRVLCSHCPYYAEDGRILHCLANHGTIKVWRYHPEPLNIFEKFGFLAGALFFVLFPVFAEFYGIYELIRKADFLGIELVLLTLLIILSTIGGIFFFIFLRKTTCPKCVNFSCPLNKVSKELVDIYLRRNPVILEAWEKSGYKLD